MAHINCLFGQDCPCHGLNCGCDMRWAMMEETEIIDWGIELEINGDMKFYVFDADFEQYYMCATHFLSVWRLTVEDIFMMYAARNSKIRLAPEE